MSSTRLSHPLRGFLVPYFRYEMMSASDSSYTEASPQPGVGVPDRAKSKLVVYTSSAQSDDLDVAVNGAGMPYIGGGLALSYKLDTEADTAYRGWQPPNVPWSWYPLQHDSATTWGHISATVIPSSQKIVALYIRTDATYTVRSHRFDPYTGTASSPVNLPEVASESTSRSTAICCTADERLVALVGDDVGLSLYYSDDAAATWTMGARTVITTAFGMTSIIRARLYALPDGNLFYWFSGTYVATRRWYQYVSSTLGTSWDQVEGYSHGASTVDHPEVVVCRSGKIGMVSIDSGTNRAQWRSIASPYDTFSTAMAADIATTSLSEVTAYVEPDGRIWVLGRSAGNVYVYRSDDEGETWAAYDHGLLETGDTQAYPTNLCAVSAAGRGYLLHQWAADPGDEDASLGIMGLGGWTSVTLSEDTASSLDDIDARRVGMGVGLGSAATWFPWDEPGDMTTWTPTGAGTDTFTSGALQITTSASQRYYSNAAGVGANDEIVVDAEFKVTSGGDLATTVSGFRVGVSDGAARYLCYINADTTGFRVINGVSGGTLATVTYDMTTWAVIRVCIQVSRLEVYYRRPADCAWTLAYEGTLTSTASATGLLDWGHVVSGTATSSWYMFCATWGASGRVWDSSASGSTSHDRILGHPTTAIPYPLGDDATAGATFLRAVDGPGYLDEVHSVAVVPDYPVGAIHAEVDPSPGRRHRTTGTAETIYAWAPDGTLDTLVGRSQAVAVLEANYRTAYWEAWDGAAWATLGTLDLATGFTSLSYTRSGNTLRINGGSAASRYVWANELVGATVDLGSSKYRKIARHTPGIWSTANGAHVEIVLEDVDGTEPSSGTMNIWARSGVLIVHNISTLYDKYRLRIASQSTADGYLETGKVLAGRVQVAGHEWDWGSNYQRSPNVEVNTTRAGTSRRRRLGAALPRWTIAWVAGMDQTGLRGMTPDWLGDGASASEGLVNHQDVPWLLWGLLEELRSGETPVVVLASIPTTSGTTITDPTLFHYGYIASPVDIENVQGNEGTDEVHRVQTVTVEGIV